MHCTFDTWKTFSCQIRKVPHHARTKLRRSSQLPKSPSKQLSFAFSFVILFSLLSSYNFKSCRENNYTTIFNYIDFERVNLETIIFCQKRHDLLVLTSKFPPFISRKKKSMHTQPENEQNPKKQSNFHHKIPQFYQIFT